MFMHMMAPIAVALLGLGTVAGWRLLAAAFPVPMRRGACPQCGHRVSCRSHTEAFNCFFCNHAISLRGV